MLLLSRVCAEFRDRAGAVLFTVTPQMRLTFQEAPESICQDPLFDMLLRDHSIEVAEEPARRKQLENDPEKKPEKTETVSSAAPAEAKASGRKSTENK